MAARTFALPTLARSAIRATGRVHFPVAAASFRMTASTAIASVFRSLVIDGGTTTVAARNRRPHATRWAVSDLLRFSTIRVSITASLRRSGPSKESTCPISFNGGSEAKVGAADFGQRPLSYHAWRSANEQSTGEAERLCRAAWKPAESPRLSMPSRFCCGYITFGQIRGTADLFLRLYRTPAWSFASTAARHLHLPDAVAPAFGGHAASGFDSEE